MGYLILIRHSAPEIQPGVPACEWPLSTEGWQRCRLLSDSLLPYALDYIVASTEKKAAQTAQAAAHWLGIPWQCADGLEEHHRQTMRIMPRAEFQALVAHLLDHPDKLVFGEETGAQALERFSSALEGLLNANPRQNLAVVTHGTVLSLWAAQRFGLPAYEFWRDLGMPAYLVVRQEGEWRLEATQNISGDQIKYGG
jgi:broad specificity phosphatase PhoE